MASMQSHWGVQCPGVAVILESTTELSIAGTALVLAALPRLPARGYCGTSRGAVKVRPSYLLVPAYQPRAKQHADRTLLSHLHLFRVCR